MRRLRREVSNRHRALGLAALVGSALALVTSLLGPAASAATQGSALSTPAPAAPSSTASATAPVEALKMEARHLDLDLAAHRATLTGDVRLTKGDLTIRADKVEAEYDDAAAEPRVTRANASGGVVAALRGVRAEAPELELDLAAQTIHLTSGVRVSRGGGWVTAASASIHLGSLKVSMTSVKGVLPIADVSH